MCGIFGYIGENRAAGKLVLEGLKKLEYRGYDSWGIVCFDGKKLEVSKEVGKIGDVRAEFSPSLLGIGQTRWATHGGVTRANAHPHFDCSKKVAIVHNGIVENYQEIKKGFRRKHIFRSQTDTEIIAHLIEELLISGRPFLEAVREAFLKLEGLNALVVLGGESCQIMAVKKGSPLVVGIGENENFIASDSLGVVEHTRKIVFLEDNDLVSLEPKKVRLFSAPSGKEKKLTVQEIKWEEKEESRGKFKHFLIKEIYEQSQVLKRIAEEDGSDVTYLSSLIKKSFGTYLVGCGTASYACLAGTYFFSSIASYHLNFSVGSEFNYLEDFITPRSLVIGVSQSGETADIIESLTKAKVKKAKIAAVVNVVGSTLYRLSDFKVLIGAGQERAVLSTKAYIGQLAILLYTAFALKGKIEKGKKMIEKAARSLSHVLSAPSQRRIKKLAKLIYKREHIYVVGRGVSYPAALEIALKIKESSYIHAEGFASGELKHGVIALIEKGTPCIVVATRDETYGASIAGAAELKARGGYIIGLSDTDNEVFDYFIKVPHVGIASIIPNVAVGQTLAYHLSLLRKTDPDKPRNLAKSVTVK